LLRNGREARLRCLLCSHSAHDPEEFVLKMGVLFRRIASRFGSLGSVPAIGAFMRNSSPVALGEIIAEKYQVEGVLGEGGMGLVVSAWHLGLRQRVAIKLLLGNGGIHEASAIERFQREARAAARIRSEHVCR